MNYEEIIDGYNELRERCLELAKANNGALMDNGAWFMTAIMESDITLDYSEGGIHGWGNAYTTQTLTTEYFSFVIPFELLEEK
ncbi:hypothetical protein SEA_ANNADREAMY_134 [Streptomyces phage Annadreamy]|uniref:Uncharacterized protein n=1 Tax=Streptomyces phage Annadreamy TaxID=2250335 RepID=A0A345GTF7_9CAUD|nr:hypothetical protein HWB75_gp134 [Streptomyces phage Annadreamy]AXG66229.1 hypothetical protein SEA_ANNADREAMY_134 [Streptomyces phage Annadreamy]